MRHRRTGSSLRTIRQVALAAVLLLWPAEALAAIVLQDSLDGATSGTQTGGTFTGGGWQAGQQIEWDLGTAVQDGGLSIELTNWNPDADSPQHQHVKQHILNLYQAAHGSPHQSDDSDPQTGFINVRTGANYDNFFKFLTSPAGFTERIENRLQREPGFIDPQATYEVKITWEPGGDVAVFLDGNELITHQHGKPLSLRYVFIGTDNAYPSKYGPQADVIYKNLAVWDNSVPDGGAGGGGGAGGSAPGEPLGGSGGASLGEGGGGGWGGEPDSPEGDLTGDPNAPVWGELDGCTFRAPQQRSGGWPLVLMAMVALVTVTRWRRLVGVAARAHRLRVARLKPVFSGLWAVVTFGLLAAALTACDEGYDGPVNHGSSDGGGDAIGGQDATGGGGWSASGAGGGEGGDATVGIAIERAGTSLAYFSHDGEPLWSFGGLSDFIFYASEDAYDYAQWADWAQAHGMNHLRAYPPFSWRNIEDFADKNGGSADGLRFPFVETSPGSRRFDLDQFDPAYWERFRAQLETLQSRGIIVHLLMINGWQLGDQREIDWGGHFFNPDNNVNGYTDHLAGNRLAFYRSVADGRTELVEAQRRWYRKLMDETHDLDNVYFDLVHEIAENRPDDWPAVQSWIETMAAEVRDRWAAAEPHRPIVLGMDTGGLADSERAWIFERPYFDVLIYGKSHAYEQARDWRLQFLKPYIPQESWDDDWTKYSYRHPSMRVHSRKYMAKLLLAKCQQMDLYIKFRKGAPDQLPGYEHNYDPNGWNAFEDDALVLRALWDRLTDYPNLDFVGAIAAGPGAHQYVLSSPLEALAYVSSATAAQDVDYGPATLVLEQLALEDGTYVADLVQPAQGIVDSLSVEVSGAAVSIDLPAFTDDLFVHLHGGR